MAYYNGKKIFTKIVINGVPRVCRLMLTKGDDNVEESLENNILKLIGDNVVVINDILTITDNSVSANNNVLIL